MSDMHFAIVVNRPVEAVFQLIADLPHYGQWLPSAGAFSAVSTVSDNPIKLGTTYVDNGTSTVMQGQITVFEPPNRITFRQNARFQRFIFSGGLHVQIQYTLAATNSGTQVKRDTTVEVLRILKLLQPVVLRTIRKENERILQKMKAYLEAQA